MSGKTIQDVLDHKNQLIPPGTWHDAFESLAILGFTGVLSIAFNDWRLALPGMLLVGMHVMQLFMFMRDRRRAMIEWTFMTFIADMIVGLGVASVLYNYADTVLGTNVTPALADSKMNNIIKAAALGGFLLIDLIRFRQFWSMQDEEEREAEVMAVTREYIESNMPRAPRAMATRPAYYALTTKSV